MDNGLPKPEDSILWTDFFGNGNGKVVTGPPRNWRLFNADCCLERDLGPKVYLCRGYMRRGTVGRKMIGRKIIGRGQLVERLLASRIIGQADNSSKDWWSKRLLVKGLVVEKKIRQKI